MQLRLGLTGLTAASLLLAGMASAEPSPFSSLIGAWRGTGEVILEGGAKEAIRCNAYYTNREGGGLGLAIRCASQSYNIELRSQLVNEAGAVKGSWEERNFNAVGNATGRMRDGLLQLTIDGGGLSGSMSVATSGTNQTVSISTQGTKLQGVSIRLSKG